ncbi:MAG TPA: hypothetical protein DCP97_05015 [Ruminococcaceae bacterium]|jgi:hypothetical protein|nr:hypothetical protein [Oscillospiraceae bacterium]
MPVSKKTGELYYTDEQWKFARYQTSALEYAKQNGYPLVKKGSYYIHAEHDSMVFTENGQWFWNSHGLKGGAIEFITSYEHKSLKEAVLILNGEKISTASLDNSKRNYTAKKLEEEKAEFVLPAKNDDYKRMFAYLRKERCLDYEILSKLVHNKQLYESKEHHNCVFVSYDNQGNPKAAFQRGTISNAAEPFKRDVPNSDKSYSFVLKGYETATTVAVFEAAIDAISQATIEKMHGLDYMTAHRLALGGIFDKGLMRFLDDNPQIKKIALCLDNDDAGRKNADVIRSKLENMGKYEVFEKYPDNKDWNEDLKQLVNNIEHAKNMTQNEKENFIKSYEAAIDYGGVISNADIQLYDILIQEHRNSLNAETLEEQIES